MARGRPVTLTPGQEQSSATQWEYCYYRRPDGSIDASPVGKGHFHQMSRQAEGWEPLLAYGGFEWTEHLCQNPLETLFARGGAKEVSLAQILENGWHQNPPIVPRCNGLTVTRNNVPGHTRHGPDCWRGAQPVDFPQLEGETLPPFEVCELCDRDNFPTKAGRDQHVRVMHHEELLQMRIGEATGKAVEKALARMGVKPTPYLCGLCQDSYSTAAELSTHIDKHTEGHPARPTGRVGDPAEPTPSSGRTKGVNTDGQS